MLFRSRFKLSTAQAEVLNTVDDLRQSAILEDAYGYYARSNMMLRVADWLYNEVALEKLMHEIDA